MENDGINSVPPRIGLIYGGICWQYIPWNSIIDDVELIDLYELSKKKSWKGKLNLLRYDILIVPWAPDQITLRHNREQFIKFLDNNGILIAFGEFDENWIPQTSWRFELLNTIEINNNSNIFKDLTNADISNWDDSAHGWFSGLPKKSTVIASGLSISKEWVPVAFYDDSSFNGSILAMSLDPDFHTYNGIPQAKKLLKNCVNWAFLQYFQLPSKYRDRLRKKLRRKKKIIELSVFGFLEILMGIIIALLVYIILG